MCNVSANISALLWLLSHSCYYSLLNEPGATEGPSIPDRWGDGCVDASRVSIIHVAIMSPTLASSGSSTRETCHLAVLPGVKSANGGQRREIKVAPGRVLCLLLNTKTG